MMTLLNGVGFGQVICPPQVQWQKVFGSTGYEGVRDLRLTPDGGFLLGGTSGYQGNPGGNKTSTNYGNTDFWLVRVDAAGNKLWDQSYGSSGWDNMYSIQPAPDGGFFLGGSSWGPADGSKTAYNYGYSDFWVVRIDSAGKQLWDKSFGGSDREETMVLQVTSDRGLILGGASWSDSNGNKTELNYGLADFWVIRTDANGNILWQRSFGGNSLDELSALEQTSDGGFILGGTSMSDTGSGNKSSPSYGGNDYWVVRLDGDGNELWQASFGGGGNDRLYSLAQTADGGFVLGGYSDSPVSGNKTTAGYGYGDFWVVRLDAGGNKLWENSYGGTGGEALNQISVMPDHGFLLSGWSSSGPGGSKASPYYGSMDYWLVRTDANGQQIWDASFGGGRDDEAFAALPSPDGGYLVAGISDSGHNGNKTVDRFDSSDIWVLKLLPENPEDCDNDGVPNGSDACPDTTFGAIVDATGCSIAQYCHCNGFDSHDEYVACVRRTADDFEQKGVITSAQKQQIVDSAAAADCPPDYNAPEQIIFGLSHHPKGDATLQTDVDYYNGVLVQSPQSGDIYGFSVLLGEADSGVFFYPDGWWGSYNEAWFLEGKAYGRLNGTNEAFISKMHVTKPTYEVYPVDIDLSGLQPQSLTFQVFERNRLVTEATIQGASGSVTVYSSTFLAPRGNPLWRMPDGNVGALIDFTADSIFSDETNCNFFSISGPFGDACGDQVFIRANGATQHVAFVSRVEVRAAAELDYFQVTSERLGIFNHPNLALGRVRLDASGGRLNVAALGTLDAENPGGVLVQAPRTSRLEVDLLPLELQGTNASLNIFGSAFISGQDAGENIARAQINRNESRFNLHCDFSGLFMGQTQADGAALEIKAFRNGTPNGTMVVSNYFVEGVLAQRNDQLPEFLGSSLVIDSNSLPSLAISFKDVVVFTPAVGTELSGNNLRFTLLTPPIPINAVSDLSLLITDNPSLTITGERSSIVRPALNISARSSDTITLSWSDNTRLYALESATNVIGPYTPINDEIQFIDNLNTITLQRDPAGQRFFRLHSE